uniref:Alcohol dehydrogenase subunit III n=1 Tax=Acetobacter pasteurianus TaxID=438 RepID=C9K504_ACEPA|nr:alcohol dehydrogenase subunit III [Acetobacter pasteurianus]
MKLIAVRALSALALTTSLLAGAAVSAHAQENTDAPVTRAGDTSRLTDVDPSGFVGSIDPAENAGLLNYCVQNEYVDYDDAGARCRNTTKRPTPFQKGRKAICLTPMVLPVCCMPTTAPTPLPWLFCQCVRKPVRLCWNGPRLLCKHKAVIPVLLIRPDHAEHGMMEGSVTQSGWPFFCMNALYLVFMRCRVFHAGVQYGQTSSVS